MDFFLLGLSVVSLILAIVGYNRAGAAQSNRAIIAQYEPPKKVSVLVGAILIGDRKRSIAAQLVDFSVRRIIRILSPENPGEPYRIELRDRFLAEGGVEEKVLRAMFGGRAKPGALVKVNNRNRQLSSRLAKAQYSAQLAVRTSGFQVAKTTPWRIVNVVVQIVFVIAMVVVQPGLVVFSTLLLIATIVFTATRNTALTERGVDTRDHLLGLKLFISLAEADRMAMLQSPNGALKQGEIFLLTEKLLGWAVLFGYGREWAKILELQARELGESVGTDGSFSGDAGLFTAIYFSEVFDGFAADGTAGEISDDPGDTSSDAGAFDFGDASSGGDFGGDSGGGGDGGGGDGGGGGGGD